MGIQKNTINQLAAVQEAIATLRSMSDGLQLLKSERREDFAKGTSNVLDKLIKNCDLEIHNILMERSQDSGSEYSELKRLEGKRQAYREMLISINKSDEMLDAYSKQISELKEKEKAIKENLASQSEIED